MQQQKFEFSYKVFDSINELPEQCRQLLIKAKGVAKQAYAPYSNFKVGAVAKLSNGEIVTGSNQENASFPVGLCAERVLLASASSLFPDVPIEVIAITYIAKDEKNNHPVAPCGVCRQTLQEFENRMQHPIKLILGGAVGSVYVIEGSGNLLPLAFTSEELKKGC
ncbi:MAG: cytidine deaminase [Chitinophagaceae bacterium]|nr:cytidine deaminase [Chitinophagaceae bacterium]